jgi:transcriptional regulator of acetoin/glycerol metabolism
MVREVNRSHELAKIMYEALVSHSTITNKGEIKEEQLVQTLAAILEAATRDAVLKALERNNGNRTQTARDLGVDPRTIFRHVEYAGLPKE